MYSVYINNFKRNNSLVTNWELMFSVPNTDKFPVQRPSVKSSEDSADNFSFAMEMDSPYYDALLPLKTMLKVVYDGPNSNESDIIFLGSVLSISTSSVYHTKSITCQGIYAFFNDTYYEAKQDKNKSKISIDSYYSSIINNHNANAADKQIIRGTVGVALPQDLDKYEPSSWTQTSSLLSGLVGSYGGHMRIRYTNNNQYLDWYKYYVRDLGDGSRPKVTVGKNILDISSDLDVDKIFTRVIPIGATDKSGNPVYIDGYTYTDKNGVTHKHNGKAFPVSLITQLYTSSQLTDEFHKYNDYVDPEASYGIKYKTMSFQDAKTKEKLWNYTKEWIKDCYFGLVTSFTVKAIDLHIQNGTIPKILLGDCVDVSYYIIKNGSPIWDTRKLVCKSVQYDLFNPENNNYTFGLPGELLKYNGLSSKGTASETTAKAKKPKGDSPGDEDKTKTFWDIYQMIGTPDGDPEYVGTYAADSFYENGQLSGSIYCVDPEELTTGSAAEINEKKFEATLIGKITLSSGGTPLSVKWVAISSTRGIFAYTEDRYVKYVRYWYSKEAGYIYDIFQPGESSFETIAKLIEKDPTSGWGGVAIATSFRNYGQINGSVNKCYDPNEHSLADAIADPSLVFTAEIIGKFDYNNQTRCVAISGEHGVFGYYGFSKGTVPVQHWYSQVKGLSYDNVEGLIAEEKTGKTYATIDGTISGSKTVEISAKETSVPEVTVPEYSSDKIYAVGSVVTHGGKTYKCKVAIGSSGETWNPEHWEEYGITAVDEYSSEKSYAVGDIVAHGGKTYKCKVAIGGGGETWNPNHWEEYNVKTITSKGTIKVGRDLTSSEDTWQVKLNETIAYLDEDGNLQVSESTVGAGDFHVESIPSFKTKLGIFDQLIAGKIDAQSIKAEVGYIRNLSSGNIQAEVYVSADKIYSHETHADNHFYLSSGGNGHYIYQLSNGNNRYLDDCLHDIQISEENGVITVTCPRLNGSTAASDSFNMASTKFFKDAVEAARQEGDPSVGWIAARTLINSSWPSGDVAPDTKWNLKAPSATYNVSTPYPLTVASTVEEYSYSGAKANVLNVSLNDHIVYRKAISYLYPENIKKGITILGIEGTHNGPETGWIAARNIINSSWPSEDVAPDAKWNLKAPSATYNVYTYYPLDVASIVEEYTYSGAKANVLNVSLNDHIVYRKAISYLYPENIKKGITILGIEGTHNGPETGWKEARTLINSSWPSEDVAPDAKWNLQVPSSTYNVSASYPLTVASTVEEYTYSGAKANVLNVKLNNHIVYRKAISYLNPENIKKGVKILGITGTHDGPETGWTAARGIITNTLPKSTTEQEAPDTNWVLKVPSSTYGGSTSYNVSVASNAVDYSYGGANIKVLNVKIGSYIAYRKSISNLSPANIKKDVKILGVTGTYNPSAEGWTTARGIIVNSLPKSTTEQEAPDTNWVLKVPSSTYGESTSYNVSVSSNAEDYSYSGTNMKVLNVKIGSYIAYRKSISNLSAANIKKGVKILGVTGTHEGSSTGWTAARGIIVNSLPTSTTEQKVPDTKWTLKVPSSTYGESTSYNVSVASNAVDYSYGGADMKVLNVTIGGTIVYRKSISNLSAANIKSGVSILGVSGTYQGGSNVTNISIWNGDTEWTGSHNITSDTKLTAWCKINGEWTSGSEITVRNPYNKNITLTFDHQTQSTYGGVTVYTYYYTCTNNSGTTPLGNSTKTIYYS